MMQFGIFLPDQVNQTFRFILFRIRIPTQYFADSIPDPIYRTAVWKLLKHFFLTLTEITIFFKSFP